MLYILNEQNTATNVLRQHMDQ